SGVMLTIPMMRGMPGTGCSSSMTAIMQEKEKRPDPVSYRIRANFSWPPGRSVLTCRITDGVIALARPCLARFRAHTDARATRTARVRPARGRTRLATGHDVVDLFGVDGLVLDQRLGHQVQLVRVIVQDLERALVI